MSEDMTLEVLHVPDCPNLAPLLKRLREVTTLPVRTREVTTTEQAARRGMAGSPTLLVNGVDPFRVGEPCECGVSCRIYRDDNGHMVSVPLTGQLRDAIAAASQTEPPGDLLTSWRARALPLDDAERAVHQAILRGFAATGAPPSYDELDVGTRGERPIGDILRSLHRMDAIRLDPDGQIVVAYPFSATPTRHRVRLDDQVDVYAMCAVDALGMSPMLGINPRIESVDTTSGERLTITTTGGATTWQPTTAVVVIGADAGRGPSADCCCDYLNFFTDAGGAMAWLDEHPNLPGQILTQSASEDLAVELFGHLLADNDSPGEPT